MFLLFFRAGIKFDLDRPMALRLQQLVSSLDQGQLQGSLGPALVATLSTDVELRQTLLQGACFFTLAAGKVDYGRNVRTHTDREQKLMQLKGQEEQAGGVMALVQDSIRKAVEKVNHCH